MTKSTLPASRPGSSTNIVALENLIVKGDLSGLSAEERVRYYNKLCETLGLNPLTCPFEYITFQGKLILYAKKGCAEQLRSVHKISIEVTSRERIDEMYVVTVNASKSDGRKDGATGVVSVGKLTGEALANAMMKAETKAKRRVTLSICGLNILDESEIADVAEGRPDDDDFATFGDNDPHAEPTFTRGSFRGRKPSAVQVSALQKWIPMVEKRLADPNPKKPLSAKERKEWEWNVEIAEQQVLAVENTPKAADDQATFENFKG